MGQLEGQLRAVRITDHIKEQHHITQPRERGSAGDLGHAAGFLVLLRANLNLIEDRRITVRLQASAVPVRAQYRRPFAFDLGRRPEQDAGHIKTRQTFEIHFLRRKPLTLHLAMNHRVQWRLGRHGKQSVGHRHPPLQLRLARLPRLQRLGHGKRKMAVQILQRLQANIVGRLPFRKNARTLGDGHRRQSQHASGNQNAFHLG